MEENKVLADDTVYTGTVIWFRADPGYGFGFIKCKVNPNCQYTLNKDKEDPEFSNLFCHYSAIIAEKNTFRTLKAGQQVNFKIGENNRGEPVAIDICLVKK